MNTSPNYLHPAEKPHMSRRKQIVLKVGAWATAALAVVGLGVGIEKISNDQVRPTHFNSLSDAMSTLKANAAAYGLDQDYTGPAQGKMERDLRGADPLVMQNLGKEVVGIAAVDSGEFQTKDGKTVTVVTTPTSDGNEDIMSVEVKDPGQDTDTTLMLTRHKDDTFDTLNYDQGPADTSQYIGGPHFDYNYAGNALVDCNTYQHADGSPVIPGDYGSAIMVDNSSFSSLTAAGPATETVLTDFQAAQNMLDYAASQLPRT